MSTRKLLIGFILSALLFFTLGFQLAADGYRLRFDSRELDFDIVKTISSSSQEGDLDLDLFWEVYSLLKEKYYHDDQLDKQELVDGAIAGMVEAIGDPYTYYLSSSETDTFQDGLDGKYEGIGVQLGYKNDNLIVVAPLEGGPAEKENVKAGDIILAINGESTANMNLGEVVQRVRGEDGSEVSLALARQTATNDVETFTVSIVREQITAPNILVSWETDSVVRVQVLRFGTGLEQEWADIAADISAKNASGVIVDVRNNPGGFLNGAVAIASTFMEKGVVVSERFGDGKEKDFVSEDDGILKDTPVVVLINESSASASEILAGALRHQADAKVIGQTSFGKNTVQEAYTLKGGKSVHVTVANWVLPNGEIIPNDGIVPDETIEPQEGTEDVQFNRALELLRGTE